MSRRSEAIDTRPEVIPAVVYSYGNADERHRCLGSAVDHILAYPMPLVEATTSGILRRP